METTPHPAAARLPLPGNKETWRTLAGVSVALWLASCASPPSPPPPAPAAPSTPSGSTAAPPGKVSMAASPREYRRDAALHLYALNRSRIYPGPLPPLLQAVGVMQVELDGQGNVRKFSWMRAPSHVPTVMAEIERTVRAAAPYPAPRRMGGVVYTDTWLWDQSGRFQLDTLTEGQRSE